jgi:hypothetical protein
MICHGINVNCRIRTTSLWCCGRACRKHHSATEIPDIVTYSLVFPKVKARCDGSATRPWASIDDLMKLLFVMYIEPPAQLVTIEQA